MKEVASKPRMEVATAEEALKVAALPVGTERATDVSSVAAGDGIIFQAQIIETLWVAARVLGGDETHVKVLLLDLDPKREIYFDIGRDQIAALVRDH